MCKKNSLDKYIYYIYIYVYVYIKGKIIQAGCMSFGRQHGKILKTVADGSCHLEIEFPHALRHRMLLDGILPVGLL